MTTIFGPPWDAPVCEKARQAPTPAGVHCLHCDECIGRGEQGFLTPTFGEVESRFQVRQERGIAPARMPGSRPASWVMTAEHRECRLLQIIGHVVGVCSCTGFDPKSREAAIEAKRRIDARMLTEASP